MADPTQFILDTLEDNWNAANTDSKTPVFRKITTKKAYSYNENSDVIFIQRPRVQNITAGVGSGVKNRFTFIDIDIRVFDVTGETHFRKVIEEVERILDANIVQQSTYGFINPDQEAQDLSDGSHNIYREMRTVKLEDFAVTR